jgi:hypothetical protein
MADRNTRARHQPGTNHFTSSCPREREVDRLLQHTIGPGTGCPLGSRTLVTVEETVNDDNDMPIASEVIPPVTTSPRRCSWPAFSSAASNLLR